jgi:hypothetical protein
MDECSVCLEVLEGSDICKTFCNHIFHKTCLDNWYKCEPKRSCPQCRKNDVEHNIKSLYDFMQKNKNFDISILKVDWNEVLK